MEAGQNGERGLSVFPPVGGDTGNGTVYVTIRMWEDQSEAVEEMITRLKAVIQHAVLVVKISTRSM